MEAGTIIVLIIGGIIGFFYIKHKYFKRCPKLPKNGGICAAADGETDRNKKEIMKNYCFNDHYSCPYK